MDLLWKGAAGATLLVSLAACGGGSGGGSDTPPITLKGASYERFVARPALSETEGGDDSFASVIYVDEGALEFLGSRTSSSGGTTFFRADDGSVAALSALPGFESTRLIRIEYADGTTSEGVIGRFTSETLMALANGGATYRGSAGTAEVRVAAVGGDFDLTGGTTTVTVDFGRGDVDVALDFAGTAAAVGAPVDRIEIDDMRIAGNRFSGGSLDSFRGAVRDPAFSVSSSALESSGVFAGWNDATGSVAGGNRPAEVAGAFAADAGVNFLTGRYLAD